eukprot:jgi/Botrbrau1/8058/Bobra.13_2s0027.1
MIPVWPACENSQVLLLLLLLLRAFSLNRQLPNQILYWRVNGAGLGTAFDSWKLETHSFPHDDHWLQRTQYGKLAGLHTTHFNSRPNPVPRGTTQVPRRSYNHSCYEGDYSSGLVMQWCLCRLFLKKLKDTLDIPVLALVDSDPYGLKILSVYMKGSMNMSYDSSNLTTPDIKWLGVRPSDLDRFNIPQQCRLPMTEEDIRTGKRLMEEDFIKVNPEWVRELEIMVTTKVKAEIQALSSFGFQYLSQIYLPLKLQEGDWI